MTIHFHACGCITRLAEKIRQAAADHDAIHEKRLALDLMCVFGTPARKKDHDARSHQIYEREKARADAMRRAADFVAGHVGQSIGVREVFERMLSEATTMEDAAEHSLKRYQEERQRAEERLLAYEIGRDKEVIRLVRQWAFFGEALIPYLRCSGTHALPPDKGTLELQAAEIQAGKAIAQQRIALDQAELVAVEWRKLARRFRWMERSCACRVEVREDRA